ncbi:C40 family peptidase [Paenibacillus beijingensis]|uniref:C40 family peptidase n=1 Tax=Paenibacillus beijingensis TaxID=1126833 RepID=UPI0006989CE0|nr:SH3 domain-containing C40 family peptidase [Paenibacillus beijingensis]
MQTKMLIHKVIGASLCAAIGFSALAVGQTVAVSTVSAASVYETKVVSGVNYRTSPSTSASKIRLIPKGEDIHVISQANKYWLQISTQDGQTGYISSNSKYTNYSGGNSPQPSGNIDQPGGNARADQVIAFAQSYMGRVHYDFGTRNPDKLLFDCSSFTQFIYRQVGVELAWGTRVQKNQGTFAGKESLQKGDLVFFDTIGGNDGVINHVGIYMGDGQFIHNTPSKDGLSINSLNTGWWAGHYVTARRVL